MTVRMVCQVRTKSGYEVESLPFDELLEETEPLLINGLHDLLHSAVHVWTARPAVEPMNISFTLCVRTKYKYSPCQRAPRGMYAVRSNCQWSEPAWTLRHTRDFSSPHFFVFSSLILVSVMVAHTVTYMIHKTAFSPGLRFSQTAISTSFMSLPYNYADIVSSLCVVSIQLGPGGM